MWSFVTNALLTPICVRGEATEDCPVKIDVGFTRSVAHTLKFVGIKSHPGGWVGWGRKEGTRCPWADTKQRFYPLKPIHGASWSAFISHRLFCFEQTVCQKRYLLFILVTTKWTITDEHPTGFKVTLWNWIQWVESLPTYWLFKDSVGAAEDERWGLSRFSFVSVQVFWEKGSEDRKKGQNDSMFSGIFSLILLLLSHPIKKGPLSFSVLPSRAIARVAVAGIGLVNHTSPLPSSIIDAWILRILDLTFTKPTPATATLVIALACRINR